MTKFSTMKPFAPGDIFLGCTYLCNPDDDRFALVTNIFTGVMSKVDLESGAIVGAIDTGMAKPSRSLAGVAVYPG